MSTETSCHFGHLLLVLKKTFCSLFLHNFFHDFIHVYSPGAGGIQPPGDKVLITGNFLSLWSSVASFKSQLTIMTIVSENPVFYLFSIMIINLWEKKSALKGE